MLLNACLTRREQRIQWGRVVPFAACLGYLVGEQPELVKGAVGAFRQGYRPGAQSLRVCSDAELEDLVAVFQPLDVANVFVAAYIADAGIREPYRQVLARRIGVHPGSIELRELPVRRGVARPVHTLWW